MRIPSLIVQAATLALLPTLAFAESPESVLSTVAGGLSGGLGGAEFGGIAEFLARSAVPFANLIAFFIIVRTGIILTISQEEDQLSKSRKTIFSAIAALVLINSVPALHQAYLGTISGTGSSIFITEIRGLISWFEVPIAVIAVLMIIVSGVKSVISYGSEQGLQQLRRTVFGVLFGMILLMAKFIISESVTLTFDPSGITGVILIVINIILGFTALVATAVIIYAGFLMIANVGNDEQYTRAKNIILRVGIGLIVIIMSFAITNFVIF